MHPVDPVDVAASAAFMRWDLDTFPHVVGRAQPVTPTEETTSAMLRCFEQLVAGPARITLLFDVTEAKMVPIAFLKRVAKFMQTCKPKILQHLLCSTVVCGASTKMLLDLFFTLFTPARPNRRFRTEPEAVAWTLAQWESAQQPASIKSAPRSPPGSYP